MLNFKNLTPFSALTYGCAKMEGVIGDVVVVKAQYALAPILDTASGTTLTPSWTEGEEQLWVSDETFGAIHKTSIRHESDLAPYKPRCDVIVIGSAHSPTGLPVRKAIVGVDIADRGETVLSHRLAVHGPREVLRHDAFDRGAAAAVWLASFGTVKAPEWHVGEAEPFVSVPLRYELGFGGN